MGMTEKELQHLADLSALSLSEAEMAALGGDLERILGYVRQLDELDTTDVEPTFQVYEMENIWRPDEIVAFEADREELLALAPESKDNQIKVPKVL